MRGNFFAVLSAVGALGFAHAARADQTFSFWLNGDGSVTAHGTITVASDPFANPLWGTNPPAAVSPTPPMYQGAYDPPGAQSIVSVTGVFSNSHLGIENLPIDGLVANDYMPHFDPDPLIPYSFGWYNGTPGNLSYDNLFYVNGSPQTCEGELYGGFLDNYGLMFTVTDADGNVYGIDVWSNGYLGADPPGIYGVGVSINGGAPDFFSGGGLTLSVPEPATWTTLMLGFFGLGLMGARRKGAHVA